MTLAEIIIIILLAACLVLLIMLLLRKPTINADKLADAVSDEVIQRQTAELSALKMELVSENRANRTETNQQLAGTLHTFAEALTSAQRQTAAVQNDRLNSLNDTIAKGQTQQTQAMNEQLRTFSEQNKASLDTIRQTVQGQLESLQKDNHAQLDQMRQTVDEKLQKTLNDRITQSFQLVNERLQEVYTGLGEMKNLATGVGDLKKVLSNVKTRGIVGEYQLGAIISEILAPEQYEENAVTKKGATTRVEFAIKLPGEDGHYVYLPVDSKFPGDTYSQLVDAYDTGDTNAIAAAQAALEARIKGCAKDIRDKYIDPPNTTDFGIMFLPFEGLYAEVVRMGLVDVLQRQYRVNIAGPTTFAALLNSLQMGFRTLAIQKRSGEVWNVLGAVKTEFETFETVLTAAQKRIEQTGAELDKLVGVRTRQINRKLKDVSSLPAEDSVKLLDSADTIIEE